MADSNTSTTATSPAADQPVSRKRPAEDDAPEATEEHEKEKLISTDSPAAINGEDRDTTQDDDHQPAKRARTEEAGDEASSDKKEQTGAEGDDASAEDSKNDDADSDKKESSSSSSTKLAFAGEGFSSFSTSAPLSFSSVSSGAGAAAPSFNIDFSSPTPFGSLFGGASTSSSNSTSGIPALTASGFTLFSSSTPASSSSSSSSEFAFNITPSTSSLLFSSPPEPSVPVAEKIEVVTGEEGEERVHSVRGKLFKLEGESWKERGSGQLHLNVAKDRSYSRLVMRAEGALRLILNAALFPHTVVKRVQEKGVQVSAVDDNKPVLYLLRVSRREEAEELFAAIERHKNVGKAAQ